MNYKPVIVLLVLLAGIMPAVAQNPPSRVLTYQECVDSALAASPSLKAASLSAEKARVLQGTAFNPPMTEITLKQETTGGGGPENGVYFGQEFEFPSVYVSRHKALTAQTELERNRILALMLEVENQVADIYYSLLYYRQLLNLNAELGEIYESFCKVAAARLNAGESSALELMNAERVREKNRLDGQLLLSEYDSRLQSLGTVTGCSGSIAPVNIPFGPIEFIPADFDYASSAMGVVGLSRIAVADREVALAKNEFLPGIKIGATVQALIKSFNPYHIERLPFEKGNFMGFEVGLTVPLFFGSHSSRLKAADLESRISRLDFEAEAMEASRECDALRTRLAALGSQLEYYEETAIPRADEIRRLALVSYELGDIDYIEYIANIETAYALYREYADCINEYNTTVISLRPYSIKK